MSDAARPRGARLLPALLVLVTVASAVGAVVLLRQTAGTGPADRTVAVTRGDLAVDVTAAGVVTSRSASPVVATVDGTVERVEVTPGMAVERGDVLLALDDGLVRARLEAAEATLEAHEQESAALDAVVPPDPAATSRLDATLARDRIAVTEARAAVEATLVRAPQPGTLTALSPQPGSRIAAAQGGGVVGAVADLAALTVVVGVTAADVPQVVPGRPAAVTVDGLGSRVPAGVESVAPAPGPAGDYAVTLALEAPPDALRVGQRAVAAVTVGEASGALLLPRTAISTGADGAPSVLVRRRDGDRSVTVGTGLADADTVQITDGLAAGETVVVPTGDPGTRDGRAALEMRRTG